MSNPPPQLFFSNNIADMDEWAKRTGIPLTTADALGTPYARARRWLISMKNELVQSHGWRDVDPLETRLLFDIECPSPFRSEAGLPRSPNLRLQIPANASTFFARDRRVQWEMVFHSTLFPSMRYNVAAVSDLVNLLQCLLTGMLVIVFEESVPGQGSFRTTRALPKADWIAAREAKLTEIFGHAHYRQLLRAATDSRCSFKTEQVLRH